MANVFAISPRTKPSSRTEKQVSARKKLSSRQKLSSRGDGEFMGFIDLPMAKKN